MQMKDIDRDAIKENRFLSNIVGLSWIGSGYIVRWIEVSLIKKKRRKETNTSI